jgi:hypothetical protein
MTAWLFEARVSVPLPAPRFAGLLNEIKKTKLQIDTHPKLA